MLTWFEIFADVLMVFIIFISIALPGRILVGVVVAGMGAVFTSLLQKHDSYVEIRREIAHFICVGGFLYAQTGILSSVSRKWRRLETRIVVNRLIPPFPHWIDRAMKCMIALALCGVWLIWGFVKIISDVWTGESSPFLLLVFPIQLMIVLGMLFWMRKNNKKAQ